MSPGAANLFLGSGLAPITYGMGFLRCAPERAVAGYLEWMRPIQQRRGVRLERSEVAGPIEAVLRSLLPLTSVETRRFVFVPTRSDWTAFWDNGDQGTDAFPPMSYLAQQLGCSGVRAVHVAEGSADMAATILEIYGPDRTDFLNYVRSVAVGYDGARWSFSASGAVQPFEKPRHYAAQRVRERFTCDLLVDYLRALGIAAFDSDFYLPAGTSAIRIEKIGPIAPGAQRFPLAETRQ